MELSKNDKEKLEFPLTIPMIPVRDMVACPYLVSPILVGRPSSYGKAGTEPVKSPSSPSTMPLKSTG